MKTASYSAKNGRFLIEAFVQEVGEDLLVSIWGGTRPHIGAVGIAEPRPSLQDSQSWSATSSNFTFTGHKEDRLVKEVSEAIAARLRKNVVVTAGIHWDALAPRDLAIVENLARQLAQKICRGKSTSSRTGARASKRAGASRHSKPREVS
jgi:gallate decarboxylase subunit D